MIFAARLARLTTLGPIRRAQRDRHRLTLRLACGDFSPNVRRDRLAAGATDERHLALAAHRMVVAVPVIHAHECFVAGGSAR